MCGRFTQRTNLRALAEQFQFHFQDAELAPRYNIAPTQAVAIVRRTEAGSARELALVKWGLIPSWAKDAKIASQTINARAETLFEKPAFRAACKRRRCLVLADGFYEWQKRGAAKQPYFIHRADEAPFAFAGLWETWRGNPPSNEPGRALQSCTIVTTTANDLMRPLHERMPVILHPADYELWLNPAESDRTALEPLLAPHDGEGFIATPVSTHVNNPRHEDAGCLAPV